MRGADRQHWNQLSKSGKHDDPVGELDRDKRHECNRHGQAIHE
jgi:hypothetical protein